MVLKVMGMAAVMGSTYICGLLYAKKSWFRNQDLEQMKKALTIFKGEVNFSSLPIEEIFKEVSDRTSGIISMMFYNVSVGAGQKIYGDMNEIWQEGVKSITPNAYFTAEDMEYIFSFGRTLGFADRQQQIANIDLLIDYIEIAQREIGAKKGTEERLYKTLGIMCGLMISIVLF